MKNLYAGFVALICLGANAQIVNIPDANFKNALVNTPCATNEGMIYYDVDTNDDGEIQVSEAQAEILFLNVSDQNISSLEGISAFVNLMGLDCSYNSLTTLDIANSLLVSLNCENNLLTSLIYDLNSDPAFSDYDHSLDCSHNLLSTLTVMPEVNSFIDCSHNLLTNITFLPGGSIYSLDIGSNLFTELPDFQAYYVSIYDLPITSINHPGGDIATITDCPNLVSATLNSSNNYEVHNNPVLQWIDIKDGYSGLLTSDMDDPYFDFRDNPSLVFVCKDDIGNWYNEGEWFYQSESVQVDPGVNVTSYCDFLPGGGFNTVNGVLNYNCNGNAIITGQVNVNLDSQSNGSIEGVTNPDDEGNFIFYSTGSGTITPEFSNDYFSVNPPDYAYSFASTGETVDVEFCVTANGVYPDLKIVIIEISPARPGFDADYKIIYSNQGTEIQSGSVMLNFDDAVLDLVSASIPSVQSENQLVWDFTSLQPFESREILLTMNVNSPVESPAVTIGDILEFSVVILSSTDATPEDNTFNMNQIVVGGYDPNDKAVSKGQVAINQIGDFLYYTVRFQNTGTYYAENVAISDILSNSLDFQTFEFVAASHPSRTMLTHQSGPEDINKVEFFFEGINLPAEMDNEPGSHGFITFKVKPKNDLTIGTVIENSAGIYFDYNSAIVTNTVSTMIVPQLNVPDHNLSVKIILHPNPAKNILHIQTGGFDAMEIAIYNLLGQKIKKTEVSGDHVSIDIQELAVGTYFIEVSNGVHSARKKLYKI